MAAITEVHLVSERFSRKKGEKTARRVWQIHTDTRLSPVAVAQLSHSDLQYYGDTHESDAFLRVRNIDIQRLDAEEHNQIFTWTADYSTKGDTSEEADNPLDRPNKVVWNTQGGTAPYFLDRDDPPKEVVNSAGEPFDENPEREVSNLTCTITRYVADADVDTYNDYRDAVNSDSFAISDGTTTTTIGAEIAKIGGITCSERKEENGYTYYEETWTLKFDLEGWDDIFLDRGRNELINGELVEITDKSKNKVEKSQPLDGAGRLSSSAAQLTFVPYNKKSFGSLGFS